MKKIISIFLATVLSASIFTNFISCQMDSKSGDDSKASLATLTLSKTGDDSPTGYIKTGAHDKSYFKITGYVNKKNGLGFDTLDLQNECTVKVIEAAGIPQNTEITDSSSYDFKHGITYKLKCSANNYSNSATLTVKAINQYDMYGTTEVSQTLIKGLVYPYHQLYASFTNPDCTINQNQSKYLDENLDSMFTMFYGPSLFNCNNKVTDIKNLVVSDEIKFVTIYGKADLPSPSSEYLPVTITNTLADMSEDYTLTVSNYLDDDNNTHKFLNQKKSVASTNFGENLFMQAQKDLKTCGYVKITDNDGKILNGITIKIHESNYNKGWKSSDIVGTCSSTTSWTPSSNGTYYAEVICTIDGTQYSNGYSTANEIKVTL